MLFKDRSMAKVKNAEAIKEFVTATKMYIKHFGLHDWEVHVKVVEVDSTNRATLDYDLVGRLAVINVSKDWLEKFTKEPERELYAAAFHEVAELFLAPISYALSLHMSKAETDELVHRVIRFMETRFFSDSPTLNR